MCGGIVCSVPGTENSAESKTKTLPSSSSAPRRGTNKKKYNIQILGSEGCNEETYRIIMGGRELGESPL